MLYNERSKGQKAVEKENLLKYFTNKFEYQVNIIIFAQYHY